MNRKKFISQFAIGGSILFTSPMLFNACSNGTDEVMNDQNNNSNEIIVDLNNSSFADLKTVGAFDYKDNVIIIHPSENQYVALSSICTHQGCTVAYNASTNELPCPCHGSRFNINGKVLNGPAQRDLKKYTVKVDGSELIIS